MDCKPALSGGLVLCSFRYKIFLHINFMLQDPICINQHNSSHVYKSTDEKVSLFSIPEERSYFPQSISSNTNHNKFLYPSE